MLALANKQRFGEGTLLLNEKATAANVTAALQDSAKKLAKGDILFLSYSGHGGQVRDTNGDETDKGRMDGTRVLFDREFVYDELYDLWAKFKPGVRIVVFSDSCHSGTVTREIPKFRSRRRASCDANRDRGHSRKSPLGFVLFDPKQSPL